MKQLAYVSIFVIVCILTAYAKPYPLYTFEDDAMRQITIRFIGDSTVTVSNKECTNGLRCETQISFTDEYHYKWVGDRKVQLSLQNTTMLFHINYLSLIPQHYNLTLFISS